MATEDFDVGSFAASFQRFLEAMTAAAPPRVNAVRGEVLAHLGVDDASLVPSRSEQLDQAEHINLQLRSTACWTTPPHADRPASRARPLRRRVSPRRGERRDPLPRDPGLPR